MIIIGVVGQIACGKGVLKDYLIKDLEFGSFSLSSIVHEEVKKRKITDVTRKVLQDIGDELRKKYGNDILVRWAIKLLKKQGEKHILIEGIRNTGEIEYLKKLLNFFLIGVKAKRKLRFERLLKRAKPWDPKNWKDFLVVDQRDLGIGQIKSGQQVGRCLAYCDYILTIIKTKKTLRKK
jgi:dephospho-CoA kinase